MKKIPKKAKQILALTVVILWGILILTTVILAFINNETTYRIFVGLIITDIGLPVIVYAMILIYRIFSCKKSNN